VQELSEDIMEKDERDGSFFILTWVTLFESLKNPPNPLFQRGNGSNSPLAKGGRGDLKTLKIEFVILIVNHVYSRSSFFC
jgi:hypothetical protein